jgi:hypothetical protein
MNLIRRISRFAAVLAGLALVALGATPAIASLPPEPGGPAQAPIHTIVTGGMPGWQIALIAAVAALAGAALAVFLDHVWAARRTHGSPA